MKKKIREKKSLCGQVYVEIELYRDRTVLTEMLMAIIIYEW